MDPRLIELEHFLAKMGMRHIDVSTLMGDMVLGEAVWNGQDVEFVFNILNSQMVYRTKGMYTDRFGHWQEV